MALTISAIARIAGLGDEVEWTTHRTDRPGRRLWRVQAVGSQREHQSAYVKQYESESPYRRERVALRQMPTGVAPRILADLEEPRVLVLEDVAGTHIDQVPGPPAWLNAALATITASVGLPGPWPDDPPPKLGPAQAEFASALGRRASNAPAALSHSLRNPLRIPCHGDISPTNMLVVFDPSPQVRLLDYEFYGPGDPLADLAALCLTPSIDLPPEARKRLLRDGCQQLESKTGHLLATRMAGSIALWAAQCAAWYHRQDGDMSVLIEAVLDNAATAIDGFSGGAHDS